MFRFLKAFIAARKFLYLGKPLKGEIPILAVKATKTSSSVTLPLSPDTSPDGIHSMFWDNRKGHSLVEALPVSNDETREFIVLRDFGKEPEQGDKVWLSGWNGETPEHFALTDVAQVRLSNGTAAYLSEGSDSWVIHVHGRTASMAEPLRNFSSIQSLGFSQLSISHETDKPPFGLGKRRSHLGVREWSQVEEAVKFAIGSGARSIVLFGFSLGAMFIGEFLRKSEFSKFVRAMVFDSPLVDFEGTLNLQSVKAGLDRTLGTYGLELICKSNIFRIFGLHEDYIPSLLWPMEIPGLVLYSPQDGYVEMQRVPLLAELNPQFKIVAFANGRHCRLFNQEPERYSQELLRFLEDYRT